ncbi:ASPIC/UnbV domain protein [Rhodopirellula maiorica SM1]|uniref:ASPIC/UnbV domain protein n=1 Tax=Rhodopirellula maiorica SM1 TaxID=1265738 RepID=M5RQ91_9BACT|nr:FG-GAP-like repeat-containing protein [Rhodopirellula maiorica]EMI21460.1 ASPIC/UnbV domain protein [Rhodopirellula maiorica SM1]
MVCFAITAGLLGCREANEAVATIDSIASQAESAPKSAPTQSQRMQSAGRLIEAGATSEASLVIRDLLIEDPDDLQFNTLMLRVMVAEQDIAAAVALLDRMADVHPARHDDLHAHAANLLYHDGAVEQAIDRLESLLTRSPAFHEARRRLAQMLNQQGYMFDANEQIRILIRGHAMTLDELVSLIFPDRSWIAVKDIPQDRSEWPTHQWSVMKVASAYRIDGNPRLALQCLSEHESNDDRTDPATESLRGRVLADAQMYDRLRDWVSSAPTRCQRYPDYWIACGNLAIHDKDDGAIACFTNAIQREPHSLDAHYGMIQSLENAGRMPQAELFRKRSQVLDTLGHQVRKIRDSTQPNPQDFVDLATGLMSVGRSIEAIAWQEFALALFSPRSPQRHQIGSYKARVLAEFPSGNDEATVLCGLDLGSLPSVDRWLATLKPESSHSATTIKSVSHALPSRAVIPQINAVFQNVAERVGIEFRYRNAAVPVEREFQIFQAFGGGVACLDVDRDGSVDFYFGQAATTPPDGIATFSNALFRNRNGQFANVIAEAAADHRGYTMGVTAGDWNQDGFADLMIGNLGRNKLLINQGDGTFRPAADNSLAEVSSFTSSVAIADVTGDSLPDIVEINYLDDPTVFDPIKYDADGKPISLPGPLQFQPAMDRVWVSKGDGSMVPEPLGGQVAADYSTGLALLVTDLDQTPGNDVFVANDLRANQLWVRRDPDDLRSARVDVAVTRGAAYGSSGKPMACMGIAAADFDGNGRTDLHITNFENEWSNQYMQNESGVFVDSAVPYQLDTVSRKMLGFGTQAIDYDNNTVWDLIVGNGHIEDLSAKGSLFAMPTQLLAGRGNEFVLQHVLGDDEYWSGMHFSRAMAKCDFNRDGRVDIVITDLKQNAVLLENQTPTANHWLQLELVGTVSERDAIGARVTVEFTSQSLTQTVNSGDGYCAKNEAVLLFGLAGADSADRVTVLWPSGREQVFTNLICEKRWLLIEGESAWDTSLQ